MKIHFKLLFLAFVGVLHHELAGATTGSVSLEEDTFNLTMRDGNIYRGVILFRFERNAPQFLQPDVETDRCDYYIRTAQLDHHAAPLVRIPSDHPYVLDLHTPMQAVMNIEDDQLYSAHNFEAVYEFNEHQRTNTSRGYVGSRPEPNHIYVKVPGKGLYKSVLHQLYS